MVSEKRVPKELFKSDGHYLGRPADSTDRIISRRVELVKDYPNFINKDKNLLEIGCGNGASMFLLATDFNLLKGIEINEDHLVDFNKEKAKLNINNCTYEIVDVMKDEPIDLFDRIISFEVIEHLESHEGLNYYYKSLKKDGLIAISVPNKWWIFETHGAKLPLLPWNRVPFFSWLPSFIHSKYANARIYRKKDIINVMEVAGFNVLHTSYITAPLDILPKGKFKDFFVTNFFNKNNTKIPFKATSIFLVASKKH